MKPAGVAESGLLPLPSKQMVHCAHVGPNPTTRSITPVEAEALFPELFKIARQLRARGGQVRVHSLRVGDIDPDTGMGGTPVKVEAVGIARIEREHYQEYWD